jgi:hypothetical protein
MRKLLVLAVLIVLASSDVASGKAVNIARRVGIAQKTRTFSVSPNNFNRDKRQDFFLVRHNPDNPPRSIPYSTLYRGVKGGFKRYASRMFGKSDKHGCIWGRVNRDRRPDMFCAVGLTRRSVNELWIQRRNGTFVNRAKAFGLTRNPHGRYRYATFIRANWDRRPDIYVTRYKANCRCGEKDADTFPNELWINKGGSFRKAPRFGLNRAIGAKKDNASCTQAVDYDEDGDQDLLVCAQKGVRLYANRRGPRFKDVTRRKGIKWRGVIDARLVDLNRDGDRDFVKLTSRRVTARYGNGSGRFGRNRLIGRTRAGMGLAFARFNKGKTKDIYVLSGRGKGTNDKPDRIFLKRRGRRRYGVEFIRGVRSGGGDDVAPIDYNRDRRTEFLVTNGDRKTAGPVQLFVWRRG